MSFFLIKLFIFLAFVDTALFERFDLSHHLSNANVFAKSGKAPTNGNSYNCDVPHLNAQQYNFNAALNISTDFTWKNALEINNGVYTNLARSVDDYINVCKARKNFYNSLGATYSDCTNLFFLFSQLDPTSNVTEAYVYSSLWTELDFMCNGGLEIGIESFRDIWAVYTTPAFNQCIASYLANVTVHPEDFCSIVKTYAYCVQEAYISEAQIRQNGWWLCESIRYGYARSCPDFRCQILTS